MVLSAPPPARVSRSSTAKAKPGAPSNQAMWVALDWIEAHCVVPDGFNKGKPFTLYDYQGRYLRNFYLVRGTAPWVPENPVLAPAFVYRRGLLVGPQKIGKNPLIAAQVCLEFVGPALFGGWAGNDDGYACAEHGCPCGWEYVLRPGEPKGMPWPTPKIQITAFSEDSTENTYDALRPMISQGRSPRSFRTAARSSSGTRRAPKTRASTRSPRATSPASARGRRSFPRTSSGCGPSRPRWSSSRTPSTATSRAWAAVRRSPRTHGIRPRTASPSASSTRRRGTSTGSSTSRRNT
jgi:hypothetical protein